MPTVELTAEDFNDDSVLVADIMIKAGIAKSKGECRRLIEQGGVSVDDEKVTEPFKALTKADFEKGYVIVKKGKKVFYKAVLA